MRLLILFIFFLPTTVYAHGTIIITNVEHDEGYIDLKIYNNKENFLKEDLAVMMALNLFFITNNDSNTNNSFTADIEELYFESNQNDIINLTSNED